MNSDLIKSDLVKPKFMLAYIPKYSTQITYIPYYSPLQYE